MRRAAKKDETHYKFTKILQSLRDDYKVPISFFDIHQLKGVGDMLVGIGNKRVLNFEKPIKPNKLTRNGVTVIVEIKTKSNDKLTETETNFLQSWYGNHCVVNDFDSLLMFLYELTEDENTLEWITIIRTIYNDNLKDKDWK